MASLPKKILSVFVYNGDEQPNKTDVPISF